MAEAKNNEELKLEIADVLEVLENILAIKNISFNEIQNLKTEKQNKQPRCKHTGYCLF